MHKNCTPLSPTRHNALSAADYTRNSQTVSVISVLAFRGGGAERFAEQLPHSSTKMFFLEQISFRILGHTVTLTSPRCAFFSSSIKVRDWPMPPPMLSGMVIQDPPGDGESAEVELLVDRPGCSHSSEAKIGTEVLRETRCLQPIASAEPSGCLLESRPRQRMPIRTIFRMAEDCAQGRRLGWEEFARDYAGIARSLLEHYFPTLSPEIEAHVLAIFERARAGDSAWFSTLRFTNEREFLMAFRDFVFAYGREIARLPVPRLSLEQVREIMHDLPVVEREMLWMFIKGYSAEQIAPMLMNAAATAESVKAVATGRLARILPGPSTDALTVSCRALMEAAEKSATEQCLSLKTFNNIINGQISWRERELAEEHMGGCFYCIDRCTTFQEMIRFRKDVAPLSAPQIEAMVSALNLPVAKEKGVFSRLFSR